MAGRQRKSGKAGRGRKRGGSSRGRRNPAPPAEAGSSTRDHDPTASIIRVTITSRAGVTAPIGQGAQVLHEDEAVVREEVGQVLDEAGAQGQPEDVRVLEEIPEEAEEEILEEIEEELEEAEDENLGGWNVEEEREGEVEEDIEEFIEDEAAGLEVAAVRVGQPMADEDDERAYDQEVAAALDDILMAADKLGAGQEEGVVVAGGIEAEHSVATSTGAIPRRQKQKKSRVALSTKRNVTGQVAMFLGQHGGLEGVGYSQSSKLKSPYANSSVKAYKKKEKMGSEASGSGVVKSTLTNVQKATLRAAGKLRPRSPVQVRGTSPSELGIRNMTLEKSPKRKGTLPQEKKRDGGGNSSSHKE